LYKFIYLKVSSKEIAEDILSETFFKCLSNLEKFEPKFESALKSWIYTIAYNLVKDFGKFQLTKIVEAYKCIICHDTYEDKIYKDFKKAKQLFYAGKTKCLD